MVSETGSSTFRCSTSNWSRLFSGIRIDNYMVPMKHLAVEDLQRKRVLNEALQRPLERPRTIRAIVAGEHQLTLRLVGQLDRDLAVGEQLL